MVEPHVIVAVLEEALMLPPTSRAAGLKPHITWSFDSEAEAKQGVALLSQTQEAARSKYAEIRFEIEVDDRRRCHNIIIWHQAPSPELQDDFTRK